MSLKSGRMSDRVGKMCFEFFERCVVICLMYLICVGLIISGFILLRIRAKCFWASSGDNLCIFWDSWGRVLGGGVDSLRVIVVGMVELGGLVFLFILFLYSGFSVKLFWIVRGSWLYFCLKSL